jgi:hypothetical protein
MPFTLAHPAAVFPLARFRTLDVLPLIIGSITRKRAVKPQGA